MRRQTPLLLLTLLSAALAGLALFQHRQIDRLHAQLAEALAQSTAITTQEPAELAMVREVERLKAELEDVRTQAVATPPAAASTRQRQESTLMDEMANMIENNPAMSEMVTAQQRSTMEVLYRRLAEQYDFAPEEREYFYDLLLARQMGRVNFGLLGMRSSVTDEERAAALQQMQETEAQMREDLRTFLNSEEDMAAFNYFEDTLGIRMELDGLAGNLRNTGEPLGADTYNQLVDVIHETRRQYPFTSTFVTDPNNSDLTRINEANIDTYATEMRQANELVAQAVVPYLTPAQLEVFRRNQEQQLVLQIGQFRMAAQMFGGQGE
ncbi:MAG: hypothetical protein Q7P63_13505 [Verrucomicrobiota bacterium JB022]|nr:hypothetical protein [Verrucomicrobiota bacterium JB022]